MKKLILIALFGIIGSAIYYSNSTMTQRGSQTFIAGQPRTSYRPSDGQIVPHRFYCEEYYRERRSSAAAPLGLGLAGGAIGGIAGGGRGFGIGAATGLGLGMLGNLGRSRRSKLQCWWIPIDSEYRHDRTYWKSASRHDYRKYEQGAQQDMPL